MFGQYGVIGEIAQYSVLCVSELKASVMQRQNPQTWQPPVEVLRVQIKAGD